MVKPKHKSLKVYTDGGSRGNPGNSAVGVVICSCTNKILWKSGRYIGDKCTNNMAEYQAVIDALSVINKHFSTKQITLYSDSKLVINQLSGKWRVKKFHLRNLKGKVIEGIQQFSQVKYKWVSRNHPKIMLADHMVNLRLDEKLKLDMGVE